MEAMNDTNLFFSRDAVFSQELKNDLKKYQAHCEIVLNEVGKAAAEMGYTQNANGKDRRLDLRDFGDMVNHEAWMTDSMVRQNAQDFARDYMGDHRKKRLDEFFDRMDALDASKFDYSCLSGSAPEREIEGVLTKSEHDIYNLLTAVRADQAVLNQIKENPDYIEARYSTQESRQEFELKRALLLKEGFITYVNDVLLPQNGLDQGFHEISERPQKTNLFDAAVLAPTFAHFAYSQNMAALKGETCSQSLRFQIPDSIGEDLYKLCNEKNLRMGSDSDIFSGIFFRQTLGVLLENDVTRKHMEEAGLEFGDMIFINEESLSEKIDREFPKLTKAEREQRMRMDAIRAMLSGKDHVDVAELSLNGKGGYSIQLSTLEPDLHALDSYEIKQEHSSFHRAFNFGLSKIKTRADLADELQRNDKKRSDRYAKIQNNVIGKINTVINQKEDSKKRLDDHVRIKDAMDAREQSIKDNDAAFFGWLVNPEVPQRYTPELEEALNNRLPEVLTVTVPESDREELGIGGSGRYSPVVTFQRRDCRGSMVSLYALSVGMSMEEVLSSEPALIERKSEIGKEFVEKLKIFGKEEFLQKNGENADYKAYFEQRRREIGQMYGELHNTFLSFSAAPFKSYSLKEIAENYMETDFMGSCAQNLSQTLNIDIRNQYINQPDELDVQRACISEMSKVVYKYAECVSRDYYLAPDYERDRGRIASAYAFKECMVSGQERCQDADTLGDMVNSLGGEWVVTSRNKWAQASAGTPEEFKVQLRSLQAKVELSARENQRYLVTWDRLNGKGKQNNRPEDPGTLQRPFAQEEKQKRPLEK